MDLWTGPPGPPMTWLTKDMIWRSCHLNTWLIHGRSTSQALIPWPFSGWKKINRGRREFRHRGGSRSHEHNGDVTVTLKPCGRSQLVYTVVATGSFTTTPFCLPLSFCLYSRSSGYCGRLYRVCALMLKTVIWHHTVKAFWTLDQFFCRFRPCFDFSTYQYTCLCTLI